MPSNYKVAKDKKVNNWINLRNSIDHDPSNISNWETAFDDFLMDRIKSRYLDPIDAIKKGVSGAGFSVVTIQCSMIEFLETTITGETYKFENPDSNNYEYNDSGHKFKSFFVNRFPFNKIFDDTLAREFYANVRNGLVHEAQTKGNWQQFSK